MRANVYIDGFNLYYGCAKRRPYKWLDLGHLCQLLIPQQYILNRIRYFTAEVLYDPGNPGQQARQRTYLRALSTIPNLHIHFGHFLKSPRERALLSPRPGGSQTAWIWDVDEKGSDVNLATYLLLDAFDKEYDLALVISNDSDLAEPIRVVRSRFPALVGVVNPQLDKQKPNSAELVQASDFHRRIREGVLRISQFPATMQDAHGTINKPATW